MAGKAFQSKLEPHTQLIVKLREEHRTWKEICEHLERLGCKTTAGGLCNFLKRKRLLNKPPQEQAAIATGEIAKRESVQAPTLLVGGEWEKREPMGLITIHGPISVLNEFEKFTSQKNFHTYWEAIDFFLGQFKLLVRRERKKREPMVKIAAKSPISVSKKFKKFIKQNGFHSYWEAIEFLLKQSNRESVQASTLLVRRELEREPIVQINIYGPVSVLNEFKQFTNQKNFHSYWEAIEFLLNS